MRVSSLSIVGIGGIRKLDLTFHDGFNVICGPNGIGKTTILSVICDAFSSGYSRLKRNAKCEVGTYEVNYTDQSNKPTRKHSEIKAFEPLNHEPSGMVDALTAYIMYFRDARNIDFVQINSIPRDVVKNRHTVAPQLAGGILADDIKGWLANRVLFSQLQSSLTDAQAANLHFALKTFSVMDSSLEFKTIDASSFDVMLSSAKGDIYLEYLSSGYKSCVYLILGLTKEIEFRFGDKGMKTEEFDGVVLIDEIDLHLHPTWQAKLVKALKEMFPKAQFIVTTHSPSVLQSLSRDEIIPLSSDGMGSVYVKELGLNEYGLQGWTIEEILRDVMEMPVTTSELFEETQMAFNRALDSDDEEGVRSAYAVLKSMLHPHSILGKLIDIQAAGLVDDHD